MGMHDCQQNQVTSALLMMCLLKEVTGKNQKSYQLHSAQAKPDAAKLTGQHLQCKQIITPKHSAKATQEFRKARNLFVFFSGQVSHLI